jgi:hypothetical protein
MWALEEDGIALRNLAYQHALIMENGYKWSVVRRYMWHGATHTEEQVSLVSII